MTRNKNTTTSGGGTIKSLGRRRRRRWTSTCRRPKCDEINLYQHNNEQIIYWLIILRFRENEIYVSNSVVSLLLLFLLHAPMVVAAVKRLVWSEWANDRLSPWREQRATVRFLSVLPFLRRLDRRVPWEKLVKMSKKYWNGREHRREASPGMQSILLFSLFQMRCCTHLVDNATLQWAPIRFWLRSRLLGQQTICLYQGYFPNY